MSIGGKDANANWIRLGETEEVPLVERKFSIHVFRWQAKAHVKLRLLTDSDRRLKPGAKSLTIFFKTDADVKPLLALSSGEADF